MRQIGFVIIAYVCLMSLAGPTLAGYTYYETHLEMKNQKPSKDFWFGTDDLGRDVFTRVWYGARISLFVGVSAALIDLLIGIIWGGVAAYFGGIIDELMMRVADMLYSLPYLLVVIVLTVLFGPGLLSIIIAMCVIGWIPMARIVRGQILQLKEREFVLAAKALGLGSRYILIRHLLPNALRPIITTLILTISSAIFVEAFLSFLGLGVQAPIASWGTMAHEGLTALWYYPWRLFFPATFITITILGFNLLAETQ